VDSLGLGPGVFIDASVFFGREHIVLFLLQHNLRDEFILDKRVGILLCLFIEVSSDGVEWLTLDFFDGFDDEGEAIVEDSYLLIWPVSVFF